jgi:uncharacterized protein
MKISEDKIKYLAEKAFHVLKEKELFTLKKGSEKDIIDKMHSAFLNNLKEEERIEEEVKTLMKQFESQLRKGEVSYSKMFQIAKKELAKKKGFIL